MIPMLLNARGAPCTWTKAFLEEMGSHEISPLDLDERLEAQNPHDVYFAFDLHRVSAFRHRDDGSYSLWFRRGYCWKRSTGADQQGDIDPAPANLLRAADS